MGVSASFEISFSKLFFELIGGEQHMFLPSSSRGGNQISNGFDGHIRERRNDRAGL